MFSFTAGFRGAHRLGAAPFKASILATMLVWSTGYAAPQAALAQSVSQEQKTFDIAAQPLAEAITAFGLQAGVQISVNPALVADTRTDGVSGTMTVEVGLAALLAGTDLVWRRDDSGIAIVQGVSGGPIILPTLTIVGEKIERSYLDTQTSVGVATADDIDRYKLDELSDTFNTMANVRLYPSSQANKGMQIRGVSADGVSEPENSAPTISVIIDGVAQSSEALRRGSRGTWDMEQVEVLRGPQSTLYGPNAMAGAIVMESQDPTYDWEAATKGVYGNDERHDGAIMVNGPLMEDQVAIRIAAESRNHYKDIDQATEADSALNEDQYRSIRGKLLIEPRRIDGLSVTLMANDIFDKPSTSTVNGDDHFARQYNSLSSGFSTEELRKMNANNYSAEVVYDIDDSLSLTSVTTFHDASLTIETAPGNTAFIRDDKRRDENFSQDLRLNLEGDSALTGTIGLYTARQDKASYGTIFIGLGAGLGVTVDVHSDARNTIDTTAIYSDLRYDLGGGFSLIGGGRIQRDTVSNFIDRDVTSLAANTAGFDITFAKDMDEKRTDVALLPKLGLAYDVTDSQVVGLTVTRGYRQGFSQVVEETVNDIREVAPEYVWTTELSWRDESVRNLTWGANVFYNSYQDQQVTISNNNILSSFNAEGSYSYGAELEGRATVMEEFSTFGALGLLKTRLGEVNASTCASASCEGNDFPEAPAITASLGGAWDSDTGLFAAADINYSSEFYSNSALTNDDTQRLNDFFLTNVRAGYRYGSVRLMAYVDNLFDKDYQTSSSANQTSATVGDGRTFGLQLDAKF